MKKLSKFSIISLIILIVVIGQVAIFSKSDLIEGKLILKKRDIEKFKKINETLPLTNFIPPNTSDATVSPYFNLTPIYPNPIAVFTTCPTQREKDQIENDFDLKWYDPIAPTSLHWADYPYSCNFSTTDPTRIKIYNTIRFIKSIEFSQPLPFTQGKTIYEFLTLKAITSGISPPASGRLEIEPRMECDQYSHAYNFVVTLSGVFTRWYPVVSQSSSCQQSGLPSNSNYLVNNFIYHPIPAAELLVHESHHAITNSSHTGTNGNDANIDEMGAWAAQFYFDAWVALYSINTDENTKNIAHDGASAILQRRFSTNRCPTDPALKSVVNQIVPNTCP